MKKRTSLLLIIALFTFGFVACDKDKDNEVTPAPAGGGNSNASYEVIIDGEVLIAKDGGYAHISEAVNNYNSAISVQNKFSLDINEIKEVIDITNIHNLKIGETIDVSKYGDMAGIGIIPDMAAQKSYEVIDGTVTRVADNKLTFTATKVEFYEQGQDLQTLEVEMTGYVISDVIKQIGVYEE